MNSTKLLKDIIMVPYAASLFLWDGDDHITVSQSGTDPGNDGSRMPRHFKYTSKPILKLGLGVEWWEMKHLAFRISKTQFKRKHYIDKRRWERMNSCARLCLVVTLPSTAFRCTKDKKQCQLCNFFFTYIWMHSNNICNWNSSPFFFFHSLTLERPYVGFNPLMIILLDQTKVLEC